MCIRDRVLGIENHDRFPTSVFQKIMEDNRDERIGIVLDTVNSFACEEKMCIRDRFYITGTGVMSA